MIIPRVIVKGFPREILEILPTILMGVEVSRDMALWQHSMLIGAIALTTLGALRAFAVQCLA